MKNIRLLIVAVMVVFISTMDVHSQMQIGNDATLVVNSTLTTNGSVNNEGSLAWASGSLLFLNGDGEFSDMESSIISNLKVNGTYQLYSSLNIVNSLTLQEGTLAPVDNVQLLLLNGVNIASENGAHINGPLYHQGTGTKFYPLGKNGVYTPVTLTNVQGDEDVIVGIEAFNEPLDIHLPVGVSSLPQDWFWEIEPLGNFEGALVQLPILDVDGTDFTVLQSDGTTTTDLGGSPVGDFRAIGSHFQALGPYVLLGYGSGEEVSLNIHNIITPDHEDGKNDTFYIENIDRYNENTVILMDRWGTEVCRMDNFNNDPSTQQGCDLERLPAGNYICVVEYAGKKSAPVMITILK